MHHTTLAPEEIKELVQVAVANAIECTLADVISNRKAEKVRIDETDLVDILEAEKITGLKKSTIYGLKHFGKIVCVKRSKKLYFSRSYLELWAKAQMQGKEVCHE